MKKLLIILFVSFAFIGCATFDEIKYIGDSYYPDKGYFEIFGGGAGVGITFRTINGTDKIIVIAERSFDHIITVSKTDKILLRFTDGKELSLSYNTRVSEYEGGNYFYLRATSGVIEDFGALEMIRMTTDDGYRNFEVNKKRAKYSITQFNLIKAEATAKYGASE